MPVEKLEGGGWLHPARLPLGAGWRGHCTAPGHEGESPAAKVLEAFCNLGYADGCDWAPPDRTWDAIRFAVCPPAKTAGQPSTDGGAARPIISLRYVCEKNHLPVEHGYLEFDIAQSAWSRLHPDSRLQKMAQCFLDLYLKKNLKA